MIKTVFHQAKNAQHIFTGKEPEDDISLRN